MRAYLRQLRELGLSRDPPSRPRKPPATTTLAGRLAGYEALHHDGREASRQHGYEKSRDDGCETLHHGGRAASHRDGREASGPAVSGVCGLSHCAENGARYHDGREASGPAVPGEDLR